MQTFVDIAPLLMSGAKMVAAVLYKEYVSYNAVSVSKMLDNCEIKVI